MSVQFTSITKNADGSWSFAWAGTGPWRVVLYGTLLAEPSDNSYRWPSGTFLRYPPPIEIVPAGQKALSELYAPFILIQWYDEFAARYYVEKSLDGVSGWTQVSTVADNDTWVYEYRSPLLDDGQTYHWRVTAESSAGNRSAARNYDAYVVTPPKPVDSTITVGYSSGNVTIAAG